MTEILKCGYGELVEEKGWNKPKDKLPESTDPVLAMGWRNGATYPTTARFVPSFGWTNYWTGESMPIDYWMPLPEMPKEARA